MRSCHLELRRSAVTKQLSSFFALVVRLMGSIGTKKPHSEEYGF
jgi:hypothetical protein